jgi:hypothetical protein
VRAKPLIGDKAWFGPRRFGWGWTPVTATGWGVLVLGVAAAIVLAAAVQHARWLSLVAVAVMLAVIVLKGTSPGGSAEWREFQGTPGHPSTRWSHRP